MYVLEIYNKYPLNLSNLNIKSILNQFIKSIIYVLRLDSLLFIVYTFQKHMLIIIIHGRHNLKISHRIIRYSLKYCINILYKLGWV